MAGGIDWFRWHHGSVTDPKFQLVAKKAGARFGDVVTVWAFILENASADQNRGTIGALDFESIDFLLGAEDGTAARILDAMTARGLVADGQVSSWEKRQPKREREDNSAGRVQAFRQRKRQETPIPDIETNVTPCNATQRQETPRGEESREEENNTSAATPVGFAEFWAAYPKKVGKIAALKAWKRCKADLGEVLNAINRQKLGANWTKDGGQYIPNPATWINEGRWDDEPAPDGKPVPDGWSPPKDGDRRKHPRDGSDQRFIAGTGWVLSA